MVNGEGYKGWLTDTDGHRYYFNDKGVMQTGWLELDGKRYYLNADGVLQTGDVTIDGEIYHFALTVHNRVNRRRQMIVPIRILYST